MTDLTVRYFGVRAVIWESRNLTRRTMARSFSALVLFPAAVAGFLQHRSFLHVPRKLESPCRSAKEDNEIDVSIEFCTGCRWMLRSAWMAQELLSAFSQESLNSVTLIPVRSPAPGGIYVSLSHTRTNSLHAGANDIIGTHTMIPSCARTLLLASTAEWRVGLGSKA